MRARPRSAPLPRSSRTVRPSRSRRGWPASTGATSTPLCTSAPMPTRAGVQHRDRRRAGRAARSAHTQAAHPGHRRLLRGPLLPSRAGFRRWRPVSGHRSPCRTAARPGSAPDVLGPVVPRARACVLARRRRGPDLPDRDRLGARPPGFDTEPLWQQVIIGNGIANGTFMVAVNRIGVEDPITFYGSSFISDPYGRVLVQAPRDRPAVLVADLELDQRRDWLELFPFLTTRRPDAYRHADELIWRGDCGNGDRRSSRTPATDPSQHQALPRRPSSRAHPDRRDF